MKTNKNITIFPLLFMALGLFLFSCDSVGSDSKTGHTDMYFPVEKMVQQQVDSLKKTPDIWVKTVSGNNGPEEKKIVAKDVNWKTELAMFFDLTPNKKAYVGKFKIDSAVKENETIISYTGDDLKLAMLTIIKNKDNSVRAIYGDLESENLFYHSYYELSMVPYKAYAISGRQTLAFVNTQEVFNIQWVKEIPDSILHSRQ